MANVDQILGFNSRRSPIFALRGIAAASQPLAAEAGLEILQQGGNAADAAVAISAALNVVEPMSTGIGGDCFCLFYSAKEKRVLGANGSGRAPAALNIEKVKASKVKGDRIPANNPHAVTVPGCPAGYVDIVKKFGKLEMGEVLKPAIRLAEEGFPVSPLISYAWGAGQFTLWKQPNGRELLLDEAAPQAGEIWRNKNLARVFREIATHGKSGYYTGWVADSIVETLHEMGGVMSHEDLATHTTEFVDPISINYRGIDIYEIPPNGQGITVLMALNLLEEYPLNQYGSVSPEYFHATIESLRLAFADALWFVADPSVVKVPIHTLLSKEYAAARRKLIDPEKTNAGQVHGNILPNSDTVYLCAADGEGNACSFISSNYNAFGSGIVPKGCGFVLQNRGTGFILQPDHPNALAPKKRPYHTIIPGMALQHRELYAAFGVMGGWMQPQGHVQVITHMIDHNMDPQAALDTPRFCLEGGNPAGAVLFEPMIPQNTLDILKMKGHKVKQITGFARSVFGNGQIIRRNPSTGVLWAGSDPRCDGMALGY
jgi:gamma-glutamyltranspeptidase/glutathione hydrolase